MSEQANAALSWIGCDTRVSRELCCSSDKEVTTLAALPAVSYRGVRPWQRGGAKPSGQRTLIPRDGDRSVSRSRDCQHQGGWGPGERGMVNPGEPPLAP